MAKAAFIYIEDVESIVATSMLESNPIENVIDGIPSKVFLSDSSSCEITAQLSSITIISGISFHNHNLADAAIVVSFSTDGTTYTTPEPITPSEIDFFYACNQNASHIKLSISVQSVPVRIGQITFGESWLLPENYQRKFREIPRVRKRLTDVNGQYFIKPISSQRGFKLPFGNITPSDREEFERLLSPEYFVFIPDVSKARCFHGVIIQDSIEAENNLNFEKFNLEFWSNAILYNR